MTQYLMGIDLGTSGMKVIIADPQGKIRAEQAGSYQFDSPQPGYAEQDPGEWWSVCRECIRGALTKLGEPARGIRAVGFSGQMHGAVLLDDAQRPLRPAILHCDARSGEQVQKINALLEEKGLREKLLNPVYTGFLLTSLLWVRDQEPEIYARVRRTILPKDYLRMMLSGEICSDYSDASATLAYNIEENCWFREVLQVLGVPRDIFPDCYPACEAVGRISKEAAEATGLAEGTILAAGGGDQVMQAIGNGAILPGQATVNIGSSGQFCFQSSRPIFNPRLSTNTFSAYRKGAWFTMGAVMTSGLSMKWYKNLFPGGDYQALDREAEKIPPGSGGLLFLPYLNGERTPHVNPHLSGAFLGLNLGTTRAHLARAVMEGVAYSLNQCREICGGLGLQAEDLIASGGGARSPLWLQIQADVYGCPLRTTVTEEQAGIGAACAAGVAGGVFSSLEEACGSMVHYRDQVYVPTPAAAELYGRYYQLYKDAYTGSWGVLQSLRELGRLA